MNPSAVRLRSDRNWIRTWFPSENTGLRRSTDKNTEDEPTMRGTLCSMRNLLHHLRWGAVSAVFADPPCVVYFRPVEDGDMVIATVVISLHVKFLKLNLNDLQQETNILDFFPPLQTLDSKVELESLTWFLGATICQEQVTPAG